MARANITATRRKEIIDATVRVMAARGWNETSVDEITREANVSRGLISYHFKDKAELLSGVLERSREIFSDAVSAAMAASSDPVEQMRLASRAAILQARDDPVAHEVFLNFSASGRDNAALHSQVQALYQGFRDVTARAIRAGQERGYYRPDLDPDAAAARHQGAIIGVALQWLLAPGAFDLEATADLAIEMLMSALSPKTS
ncbi:MAG: TetR/AcrR family transcriptional regulator [bacterium]